MPGGVGSTNLGRGGCAGVRSVLCWMHWAGVEREIAHPPAYLLAKAAVCVSGEMGSPFFCAKCGDR